MRLIILSFLGLFFLSVSGGAFAREFDLCICQTGTQPQNERGFFRAGCRLWNQGQSCDRKVTASFDTPLEEILSRHPDAASVRIGYVGHWSSAEESVAFLEDSVVPLIRERNLTVSVDNTACLATDNPFVIVDFLQVLDVAERITFEGNQAISTGMWDGLLPGNNNFWARVSGADLTVTFPSCREFEGHGCFKFAQAQETGVCRDEATGDHVMLQCREHTRMVTRRSGPNNRRVQRVEQEYHAWGRITPTFTIQPRRSRFQVQGEPWMFGSHTFDTEAEAQAFVESAQRDVRVVLERRARR